VICYKCEKWMELAQDPVKMWAFILSVSNFRAIVEGTLIYSLKVAYKITGFLIGRKQYRAK
jgi:hypothetical protein